MTNSSAAATSPPRIGFQNGRTVSNASPQTGMNKIACGFSPNATPHRTPASNHRSRSMAYSIQTSGARTTESICPHMIESHQNGGTISTSANVSRAAHRGRHSATMAAQPAATSTSPRMLQPQNSTREVVVLISRSTLTALNTSRMHRADTRKVAGSCTRGRTRAAGASGVRPARLACCAAPGLCRRG